jgi:DNA invertase Pin-like site-specific DNA recombinase
MATNSEEPLVIDIYARLSRAVNGQTITVDEQTEMGIESIEARGARVGRKFKDNSKSAWNPKVVRKDFEALMARVESGESDGVWVYDITRFSRKIKEGERLIEAAARGIAVWSKYAQYDLTTADGRAHFRDDMVAAARESDKISERTRNGRARRAKRGRGAGGQRALGMPGWFPVGPEWEKGDPREAVPAEQVEKERAVIRECYDALLSGTSTLSQLVKDLNAREIRTVTGKEFSTTSLSKTLRLPYVAGLLKFRGEVAGELVNANPIVTPEEWRRLCGIFDARRRGRPTERTYVLSGVIRCGRCGEKLYGRTRPGTFDGEAPREYRCRKNADTPNGCGRNVIEAQYAEDAIADAVKKRLGDPRRAERMAQHLAHARATRAKLEAERAVLQDSADGLALKTSAWGLKRVEIAMAPVLKRLTAIDAELANLADTETSETAIGEATRTWNKAKDKKDIDALRAMVKRAFPRLAIRPHEKPLDLRPERFDWEGESLAR